MTELSKTSRSYARDELALAAGSDDPDALPRSSLQLCINGSERAIPMSPEQIAFGGLKLAAELVHGTGGFEAKLLTTNWLTIRIGLSGCAQTLRIPRRISALAGDLLQMSMDASEHEGTPPCCIPGLRVVDHGAGQIDVDLYVERTDARGRAFLETAAHAILPLLARVAECESPPLVRLVSSRIAQVRVSCRVDVGELLEACSDATRALDGSAVERTRVDELLRRYCSSSHQPDLAAQHNDHLLASVSAAAFELGLDTARIVLGARAHATRWGSCEPLANWRRSDRGLIGQLALPFAVDGEDAARRMPRGRERAAIVRGQTPGEWVAHDPLVGVACVGLTASLGFLQKGVAGQVSQRRPRTLLPPPLPAHGRARPAHPRAEKGSSESGVRPAVRDCDIQRARTGSDPY